MRVPPAPLLLDDIPRSKPPAGAYENQDPFALWLVEKQTEVEQLRSRLAAIREWAARQVR